jgi:hypothetical protein
VRRAQTEFERAQDTDRTGAVDTAGRQRGVAASPAPLSGAHGHDGRRNSAVVLAVILREYPVLLTFPALACELFENPNDLAGGMALARAVRDLVEEGLLYSNGLLVLPSRSALRVRRLSGGDGWAAWR